MKTILEIGKNPTLNTFSEKNLYSQLFRAASSIGANIAEGYGRNNPKEYKQFLGIARGSAMETQFWLELAQECFTIDASISVNINSELIKITTVTIKNLSGSSSNS